MQVDGAPSAADAEVGTALEAGLAVDLGTRLRVSLTGAYLPDAARPDQVARGLWRLGPAVRLFLAGPSEDAGPWAALGAGLGATTDAARPYARIDLGWSLGHAAQLGLQASVLREVGGGEPGATFAAVSLRFDGVLPGPWAPRAPRVAASPRSEPAPEPELPLPAGTPLDPETVRTHIRENRDDVETCVALSSRHGELAPPRVDLALVILPAGRVHAAEVRGAGDDLARCLETRARAWHFPSAQGTTRFAAPFVLQ